jgi:hypothetical protein
MDPGSETYVRIYKYMMEGFLYVTKWAIMVTEQVRCFHPLPLGLLLFPKKKNSNCFFLFFSRISTERVEVLLRDERVQEPRLSAGCGRIRESGAVQLRLA